MCYKRLFNLLQQRIDDVQVVDEIRKMLNVVSSNENQNKLFKLGVPFIGSDILSPFLFNVYLHELDQFIYALVSQRLVGNVMQKKRVHLAYECVRSGFYQVGLSKLLKIYGTIKAVFEAKRRVYKEFFLRYNNSLNDFVEDCTLYYVRFAGDFILGITGSWKDAVQVKDKILSFLKSDLHLRVNRVVLVHRSSKVFEYLGYSIKSVDFSKFFQKDSRLEATARCCRRVVARLTINRNRLANYTYNEMKRRLIKIFTGYCKFKRGD